MTMLLPYDPVIIASDTNPPSKLSRYLATAFGCKLSFPEHSLTQIQKSKMTMNYSTQNVHEKDALAAAIKAYNKIQNKMRQTDRILREKGSFYDGNYAKHKVAKGIRIDDLK